MRAASGKSSFMETFYLAQLLRYGFLRRVELLCFRDSSRNSWVAVEILAVCFWVPAELFRHCQVKWPLRLLRYVESFRLRCVT